MKKLLLALLLTAFSTSAMAAWIGISQSDDYITYADLETIRRAGNKVKMWRMIDMKTVQEIAGDKCLVAI